MLASAVVVEDEVDVLAGHVGGEAEYGVGDIIHHFISYGRGTGPSAEGFGVAPGIDCDLFPVGAVVHQDFYIRVAGIDERRHGSVVHYFHFDELFVFQDQVQVGRLDTAAVVVEDEVLVASQGIFHVEYLIIDRANLHGLLGRGQAGPVSAECHVTPHVQGDSIPAGQVLDIDNHGILGLLGFGAGTGFATAVQVHRIAGLDNDDYGGVGVQEQVIGAVLGHLDVGAVLLHLEGLSKGCEGAAHVHAPVGVLAELEFIGGGEFQGQAHVPGTVGEHGFVGVP